MKAHQIFLTNSKKIPKTLPDVLIQCMKSFKNAYSELNYCLYDGEQIEDIIKNNFDKNIILAYQKLVPLTFKCDLARACILYLYGGLYSDIWLFHMAKFNLNELLDYNFCTFRDRQFWPTGESYPIWNVMNAFMYSIPKCKIMEKHIELVVENCKHENYGLNAMDVSATLVLGKAIYKAIFSGENERKIKMLGEVKNLTFGYQVQNTTFLSDFGDIIAFKKKPKLDSFKELDGNEYNELYDTKNLYDKSIVI